MPKTLHTANEGLAFLLELAALAGLGSWGFHVGRGLAVHVVLGIGAPAVMIVIWMTFCAPRARVGLPIAGLILLRTLLLLAACAAMEAAGWHVVAVVVAILVSANAVVVSFDRAALISARSHVREPVTSPASPSSAGRAGNEAAVPDVGARCDRS